MKATILRFKDLEFKAHRVGKGRVQAYAEFSNGEWISVVGGEGLYGDGKTSFEFMSSSSEKTQRGVKGWRSAKQVDRHMRYLQSK